MGISTRWIVAAAALWAGCSVQRPAQQSPSKESVAAADAVRAGEFRKAEQLASRVLIDGARDSRASAVRAIARYERAIQHLANEAGAVMEQAEDLEHFDHARMREAFAVTEGALAEIERDLKSAAADPAFSLELCLACWERDWNGNGRIDDRDRRLLEIEFTADGTEIPEGDPRRRPTFRFDIGDIHWARAMVAFQRAGLNLVLAYDWNELDKLFQIPLFGKTPDNLVIRIKLLEPERIAAARSLILAGLDFSDREREAYLAETDDDREWVPNPRQTSSPVPLPVDQALYDTWAGVVRDVRGLIRGDTGISVAEVARFADMRDPPGGYIDVGRMLSKPKDLVFDMSAMARHTDGPNPNTEALLRDLFGDYYVQDMRPTPLIGRLTRMAGELMRGEETFDRKMRYLFWIN